MSRRFLAWVGAPFVAVSLCVACVVDGSLGTDAAHAGGAATTESDPPESSETNTGTGGGGGASSSEAHTAAGGEESGGATHEGGEGGAGGHGGQASSGGEAHGGSGEGGGVGGDGGAPDHGGTHAGGAAGHGGASAAGAGGHASGGASAGAGGQPAFSCDPADEDTACITCQKAECCDELLHCAQEPGCHCISQCLDGGATLEACVGHCGESDETGLARGLHECSVTHCAEGCTPDEAP